MMRAKRVQRYFTSEASQQDLRDINRRMTRWNDPADADRQTLRAIASMRRLRAKRVPAYLYERSESTGLVNIRRKNDKVASEASILSK